MNLKLSKEILRVDPETEVVLSKVINYKEKEPLTSFQIEIDDKKGQKKVIDVTDLIAKNI
jgi:hypothetical protein